MLVMVLPVVRPVVLPMVLPVALPVMLPVVGRSEPPHGCIAIIITLYNNRKNDYYYIISKRKYISPLAQGGLSASAPRQQGPRRGAASAD